jgi:hypothetical protein
MSEDLKTRLSQVRLTLESAASRPGDRMIDGMLMGQMQTIDETIETLEQLQSQLPKWVSVTERFPERGVMVLTITATGAKDVDYINTANKFTQNHPVDSGDPVTHWMPLPTPPEGV